MWRQSGRSLCRAAAVARTNISTQRTSADGCRWLASLRSDSAARRALDGSLAWRGLSEQVASAPLVLRSTAIAGGALVVATMSFQGSAAPNSSCEADAKEGSSPATAAQGDIVKETIEQGPGRYIVYARRAVQAFLVKGRLVAFSSDVGESVRPVVPPAIVRFCYALTWGYVGVDVVYNTWEEFSKGSSTELIGRTAAHATIFQVIASVAVPAFIIHQTVHLVQVSLKSMPPGMITRWLPSIIGLAVIPVLPYLDEPLEHVIDFGFEKAWPVEKTEEANSQVKEKEL